MKRTLLITSILLLIFTCCTTKKSEKKSLKSEVFVESKENAVATEINKSDDLNAALKRIELVDDGEGSNFEVMENYAKEKDLWLNETALIRSKLGAKIEKECPELKQAFIEYNEESVKFMAIQRKFATKYMEHYYPSGVSIFPVSTFYRNEYKQRLEQYYFLYEIDDEPFIDNK